MPCGFSSTTDIVCLSLMKHGADRARPDGRAVLLLALIGAPDALADSSDHEFDHHLVKPVDHGHLTRLVSGGAEAS